MTTEWLARSLLPQPGTDHVAAQGADATACALNASAEDNG